MKKLILSCCVLSSVFLIQSCGNNSSTTNTSDTSAATTDTSKMMTDTTHKMADSTASSSTSPGPVGKIDTVFASKAASAGLMEVELGKLAQTKAVNIRVKNFADMMVTDHSKANSDLQARAASQNIMLPTTLSSDQQKEIDKLSKKTGKDFDKAYIDMMVEGHKKVLNEFRQAADKATNPSIKDFATKTLPAIEMHLDSAKAIAGKS